MYRRILLTMVFVLCATTVRADYYSDSEHGWWWGDRDEEPPVEKKQKRPQAKKKKEPYIPPPLSSLNYKDVWNLHPDQFLQLQETYKKKAVQDPTEDNVQDYYELQEIARKKALAFQNTSKYVWQKHPELTVSNMDYPTNTPGNLSRVGAVNDEKSSKLRQYKDDYALVYFYQNGCSYCEDQKNILKWFQDRNGWIIKEVNIETNPALAAKVGVTTTPTTILIKKGRDDYFPVSAGVSTAEDITDKTYRAIRIMSNDMKPEEYSGYEFQKGGSFDVNGRKDWIKRRKNGGEGQ